ncbi:MAG TPA: alpha/beta hydrolase [Bacteroidales bacterium]|jgi:pimeloyl-ACP methyl ester carboxylesterase|nr:alpha/beta hydrolase [Bacteroidales bacterium]
MKRLIRITIPLAFTLCTTFCFGSTRGANLPEITGSKTFAVEVIGQGKPILYFPGFTAPGSMWKGTVENLDLGRKSYLFSYAGFNGNEPIGMPWYPSIKNSVIEYVKDNNLSDIIIIGHSMGGNLAVEIAAELPNKVSKIIIVDALPCMLDVMMPGVPAESISYESPYNNQMLEMDEQQFKSMATMMASNMTFDENKNDILANWILEADRETWVYGYTDLLKIDLRNILRTVKCETLILGASFPDITKAKGNFEKQYANLSNKTIVMASASKHFLMFDQPEWFYDTVKKFLENDGK